MAGQERITIPDGLKTMLTAVGAPFGESGERIYLVGGAVRDIILGLEPCDLDFATSASPARIRKLVRSAAKSVYEKSRAKGYGTHGVILKDGTEVEITPFRRVAAPDTPAAGKAAPAPVSLEEDLESRDFTVNAVAMDVSPCGFGVLRDPCGGAADLERRSLRTPRRPEETFADDPLRVLRAVRFTVQYGLEPEAALVEAVRGISADPAPLARVATERVRDEIEKMLLLDTPSRGFALMHGWGLMDYWLPEVAALARTAPENGAHHKDLFAHTLEVLDRAAVLGPREASFRLAALLHDSGKPAARTLTGDAYSFHGHEKIGAKVASEACYRLRFSNEDAEAVADIVLKHHRLSAYTREWTDSAVRRALHDLGGRYESILALTRADLTTSLAERREAAQARLDDFLNRVAGFEIENVLNPKPPIDGHEIMGLLGISAGATGGGPDVGRAVEFLKDLIVAGELDPGDAETARKLVAARAWNRSV